MKPGKNAPCSCGSGKKFKKCCQRESESNPSSPDSIKAEVPTQAECRQIVTLLNGGHYVELEMCLRLLVEQYPDSGFVWKVLGAALQRQGKNALPAMKKSAELLPDDAEAHSNLGVTLKNLGQLDGAVASYRRALEIKPDFAEAHCNLGVTLKNLGQLDGAVMSFRRALEFKPNLAEGHSNLGNALKDLGQLNGAVVSYRRALQINPNYAEAHYNLGVTLKNLGQLDGAVKSFRQALEINPDYAEAHGNLGTALKDLGQLDDAVACYRRALEIKPDYVELHYNLGNALNDLGQLDDAVANYSRALEIKPDFVEVHYNLANTLRDLLQLDGAMKSYRMALEIKPGYVLAHSNLLFTLDLLTNINTSSLQEERKRWGESHADHLLQHQLYSNLHNPDRRLRIGYVSADFREHSAAYVFGAMLVNFDRTLFDVFAYSNSIRTDALTQHFQQNATHWRNIDNLSDDAVADLIQKDEIDILVDLSGHSAGNRLLVFARKPAPIQVTAWGYVGGTGMKAMDVFFADPVFVPPEEKQFYTEEIRYLPSIVGAFFPYPFPEINPLPALSGKGLTFGSLNRLVKTSEEAYRVWAQVLLANPDSRMLLKTGELDDAEMRARVMEQFARAGVAPERITLLGRTSWRDHVAAFNQIDISLDPFPQGGGVTTLEGLMMGVPVVTLRWPTFMGRISASILTPLNLTDWIADTPEQYVEIAVKKAQNLTELAELRQRLRPIFTASIIGDTDAYVRAVEQEYRALWREWCKRQLE